jgi:uncharacterized protein DUF6551
MAVSQEELPTKELRDLRRRFKKGYELERTRGNHFRVRSPRGELVEYHGKAVRLNANPQAINSIEHDLNAAGVLRAAARKPRRLSEKELERSRKGIEAMRESQRAATLRRRELSKQLAARMQPWMKKIGAETPGVMHDLARSLYQQANGTFPSVEAARHAIANVLDGEGVKDESRQALEFFSARFEHETDPLLLYVELAREARGIEVSYTTGKEWPFTMKLLDVAKCFADPAYQRPPGQRFVREMVLHFDERKVGSIQVSAREDETFAILDGQTRHTAVRLVGKQRIWAAVYEGMTLADEAQFFWEVNHNRKNVHAYYGFKARVLSGDPKAVTINALVEQVGLRVSPNTDWKNGGISAVKALEDAYDLPTELRENALEPTLTRLARWKGLKNSTAAELIRGFGRFYAAYGDEEIVHLDFEQLLDEFGPSVVLVRAADEAERAGRIKHGASSTGISLAKALVAIHNTGLPRGQRLDLRRLPYA